MHGLQIYSAWKEAMWGRVYRCEGFLRHQVTVLQGYDPRIYDNFWSEYYEFRLWEAIYSYLGVLHVSFTRVLPTNLRQLLLENRLFWGHFRGFEGYLRHQVTVLQGSDPRIYDNFWSEYDEFRLWEVIWEPYMSVLQGYDPWFWRDIYTNYLYLYSSTWDALWIRNSLLIKTLLRNALLLKRVEVFRSRGVTFKPRLYFEMLRSLL